MDRVTIDTNRHLKEVEKNQSFADSITLDEKREAFEYLVASEDYWELLDRFPENVWDDEWSFLSDEEIRELAIKHIPIEAYSDKIEETVGLMRISGDY